MGEHFHTAQFTEAIKGSRGIITTIAKRVGCSWRTARKYIMKHPSIKSAYEDECEGILDVAESVVIGNVYREMRMQQNSEEPIDAPNAKWFLARKGRGRGYGDHLEMGLDEDEIDAAIERQLARLAGGGQGEIPVADRADSPGDA